MILIVIPFSFILCAIEIFTHAVTTLDSSSPLSSILTSVFSILLWSFIYNLQCSILTIIFFSTSCYIDVLDHPSNIINVVGNKFIIHFFSLDTSRRYSLTLIHFQNSMIPRLPIEFFKSFNIMSFFIFIAFAIASDA